MKATCRWCGCGFVKIQQFYWCETQACRRRQADAALSFRDRDTGYDDPYYVPLPVQVDADLALTPILLIGGAAGVSKSHLARNGLYRRCFQIPGFEALILRKTWDELDKHHLRLMERETIGLRARGLPVTFHKTDREFRVHHPEGDSVIEGGHMDSGDVEKYLSRERDAIVPDEGSTFDPDQLLALSTRARSTKDAVKAFARRIHGKPDTWEPPRGGSVFWVPSNPGGPASSMLRDFCIDHAPDYEKYPQLAETDSDGCPLYDPAEWGYIPGNLEDNPYLPPSYERDLAVLQPWRYQQLRFNNWDILAGQFFTAFDARVHVKDLGSIGGDLRWFRSYDYGFMDPGVCLWWAILPDSRLYVRAEYKHQHLNIDKICHGIRKLTADLRIPKIAYTAADKYSVGARQNDDSGITRADVFRSFGVPLTGVSQDRGLGWTQLRELLGMRPDGLPWLLVHPSCRYLIRTLSSAVSSKTDPEDIEQKDDHALDAGRMGAMSRPSVTRFTVPPLPPKAVGHMLHDVRNGTPRPPFQFR